MNKVKKYKIKLKRGIDILIDEDEVDGVKQQISEGGLVQVRQALFDAAAFDALIEDEERTESCTYKTIDSMGNTIIMTKKLENIFDNNKTKYTLSEKLEHLHIGNLQDTNNSKPEQIKEAVRLAREKREDSKNCTLCE